MKRVNAAWIFDENKDYSDFRGWLQFERKDILKVIEKLGPRFTYERWISARINDEFAEFVDCDIEQKQFHQVRVLRSVLAPYVKDGKPRGWFKGKNDEPIRWTGISNIFYLKGENAESAMSSLLYALSPGEPDFMWYFYEAEDENTGEKFFGFHPLKREGKELI